MSSSDIPFSAEYAKSNRAACRGCRGLIAKDTLRLAIMVQSPHFDGRVPNWYHETCFWIQGRVGQQLKSEADIYHFDLLRWDDQEKIRQKIQKGGLSTIGRSSMGASVSSSVPITPKASIDDFEIEYAQNGSAKCRECGNKILKAEIRAGRQPRGSKTRMWYHLSCFAQKKQEFGFTFDPQKVNGYDSLTDADQNLVKEKLKIPPKKRPPENEEGNNNGASRAKKAKIMEKNNGAEDAVKSQLKKQTDDLWNLRDKLTANVTKKQMVELLEYNNQTIPSGEAKILDRLTDCMLFGALEPCAECGGGQIVYSSSNNCYVCTGHVSGFTSCQVTTQNPKRTPFEIPPEGFEKNKFLSKFVFVPGRERVFPDNRPAGSPAHGLKSSATFSPQVGSSSSSTSAPSKPLLHLKFAFLPNVGNDVKEKIRELGGVLVSKIDKNAVAVIAPNDTAHFTSVDKGYGKEVVAAKKTDVHVVSEEFLKESLTSSGGVAQAIAKCKICDWGSDINARIINCRAPATKSKSTLLGSSGDRFTKSVPSTQKLVVKGGVAVDPDFEFAYVAHVYQDRDKNVYNAILGRADVQMGNNSYYKLQLLEHDNAKKYWVYRSWGRTGTTIGGTKSEEFGSRLEEAKDEFMRMYVEKTGNEWEDRHNFVKKPYLYYPMDIDYGQEDETSGGKVKAGSQSKLPQPVQDLIKMIFDIEQMKQTMKEFEIDLTKMPLGKLSKKQIQSAYSILTELQDLLQQGQQQSQQPNPSKILDCTNRFFTLIPHDFGLNKIPLLDNTEIVKAKTEMLDNLMEIEVAYGILKGDTGDRDPIDAHYEKLNTDLKVLDKASAEFEMIQNYVRNTHAATHSHYELMIEEVFAADRDGEKERYAPFKDLHNRMLLWHGSRTSNYAGILSKGLRIAPPEAPMTGYMFGKGIYFADMVSKSANYCYTTATNPTGLLMLCEVALGDTQELKQASNVTKLKRGKHSVKGLGKTTPDPNQAATLPDGTMVPMGKGVNADVTGTSLLYNEYIVYDVAQVNIKYLVKLRFNYK